MITAPDTLNGKEKVHEEVFICPHTQKTEKEAYEMLKEIRNLFSHEDGWLEIWAKVKETKHGRWQVSRFQAHYI